MDKTLVAAAGEHYVAHKLSCFGYLAALVRQGSPAIDLLASTKNGGHTVGIQVKTTGEAGRWRGRGANKELSQLEFPLGHNAVERAADTVIFCFVDLRGNGSETRPDVYIIPAKKLLQEYKNIDIHKFPLLRHHRSVALMEPFKNNWKPVHEALTTQDNS